MFTHSVNKLKDVWSFNYEHGFGGRIVLREHGYFCV